MKGTEARIFGANDNRKRTFARPEEEEKEQGRPEHRCPFIAGRGTHSSSVDDEDKYTARLKTRC